MSIRTTETLSAAQVCLAPEYVLVPESFQNKLIDAMKDMYVPSFTNLHSAPCSRVLRQIQVVLPRRT